jgi:trimethylamine--corrinoid protein Co-methyltransferase
LAFAAVRDVGAVWTHERANRIFKQIMAEFEPPAMNGDHREELAR